MPVAGSYIWRRGPVRTEEPRRLHRGEVGEGARSRWRRPRRAATAPASRRRTRSARGRSGVGNHPLSGPPAVISVGVNTRGIRHGGVDERRVAQGLRCHGERRGHLRAPRVPHRPATPPTAGSRRTATAAGRRPTWRRCPPRAGAAPSRRSSSDGSASTRAASPRTASAEASAPFTISHAGTRMPSDSAHSP